MSRTAKAKFALFIGFGISTVLLIIVLTISIFDLNLSKNLIVNDISKHNTLVRELHIMQLASMHRLQVLHTVALENNIFIKDEMWMAFNASASAFVKAKKHIEALNLSNTERMLFNKVKIAASISQPLQEKIFQHILKTTGPVDISIFKDELKKQYNVIESINKFVEIESAESISAEMTTTNLIDDAKNILLLIISIAIIVNVSLQFIIGKAVARQTKNLDNEKNQFKTLFEGSLNSVLLFKGEHIVNCNETACTVFRAPNKDQLIGRKIIDFQSSQQDMNIFDPGKLFESEAVSNETRLNVFESNLVKLDGTVFPAMISYKRLNFSDEYNSQIVINDITKIKKHEEELRYINENLETIIKDKVCELKETESQLLQSEKLASIGQLSAGVAHEINNPIGYIYSNILTLSDYFHDVFLLLDEFDSLEKNSSHSNEMSNRVSKIKKEIGIDYIKSDTTNLIKETIDGIKRVKLIVRDLKDFSRVGSESWEKSDIHKGIDSALNIANHTLKNKAIVQKKYGDIPECFCVPHQLNQVFLNLLTNAAQAIENNGRIIISTEKVGDQVLIRFEDNGAGIAEECMNKIFDPFYTTKPVGTGTGLGLSVSYGIIQKHQGEITVESKIGEFTRFSIWLPILPDEQKLAS